MALTDPFDSEIQETRRPEPINSRLIDPFDNEAPQSTNKPNLQLVTQGNNQATPVEENEPWYQPVSDFFTGDDRQTNKTEGLEEFDLPFEFSKRQAKTALGLLTTYDPKKQIHVLKENYPDLKFEEDEKGNVIVDGSAYGGEKGVLNMPGVSGRDLLQAGFQVAAFTPAGRAGALATNTAGKMLAVGGASAATQAGIDLAGQGAGTTDEVSPSNINTADVVIAGAGGALFEGLFLKLGKALPFLQDKTKKTGIDDNVRAMFRGAAKDLGRNPDEITDDVIRSFINKTDEAVNPQQAAKLQGEDEFGVHLTKGQRSGIQKDLSFEDSARSGVFGGKAQQTVLDKESLQAKQALDAKANIQNQIANSSDIVTDQVEAGGRIIQGVRNAEQLADDSVRAAYSNVGDATLSPEGLNKLLQTTKKSVRGVEFDKTLPETSKILTDAGKLQKTLQGLKGNLKPFHVKQIEAMRRRLNTAFNQAEKADKRQIKTMQREWDAWLDSAVKNALFDGDKEAINSLKQARGVYSEYAKKFLEQPTKRRHGGSFGDKEGKFIEQIVEANPTDIQTVNAIFGAGESFGNQAGKNMAKKMKTILGPQSDEWNAVRQAGFMRLVKFMPDGKTISGQKTLTAIEKAMKNKELMNEVFSPQEVGLFRRFAAHVKRTQPDMVKSRENPSGTSQKLVKSLQQMTGQVLQALGLASGNPALSATGAGVQVASGFRAASRAKNAVRPFSKLFDIQGKYVGAGAAGSVAANQED